MKKLYFFQILLFSTLFLSSCGSDDPEYKEVSPVVMDLTTVPYPKLSDYKFFVGELKNLEPAYKVLPYDLNSELFTDYALKKRFVWMPEGKQATYTADGEILNFPIGAVLIKNFYYENVLPGNTTKIIETRLMIKKSDGWMFANYIWNDEQTEAYFNMDGEVLNIEWEHNGAVMTTDYKIPAEDQCMRCHQLYEVAIPIGPKPQNINKNFTYPDGTKNQLVAWQESGYLTAFPDTIVTNIDWTDETKPLDLRVRSYLDINCAHCHMPGNWKHFAINLQFKETINPDNLGICIEPSDFVAGPQTYIVTTQNPEYSLMHFRMNSTEPSEMMPIIGRTVVHEEAILLLEEWINTLPGHCP